MLTMINDGAVRCDKGYEVSITSFRHFKYSEKQGEIVMEVEWGLQENRSLIYVFEDAFFKWSDGRSIPKEKQLQIQKNFIEALDFMKTDVVID